MAPTATIESVTIVRPLKVIAFICGVIVILLMILCLASTYWLDSDGFRQGLWMYCVDENIQGSLPKDVKRVTGCYFGRAIGYIKAVGALCIITILIDSVATALIGVGLCTRNQDLKFLFYKIAMYIMVAAFLCMLIALVVFPAMFASDMLEWSRTKWEFGWAYGVAWGAAIFLFGAIMLLLCDKESEEVYYKERTIVYESGESKANLIPEQA